MMILVGSSLLWLMALSRAAEGINSESKPLYLTDLMVTRPTIRAKTHWKLEPNVKKSGISYFFRLPAASSRGDPKKWGVRRLGPCSYALVPFRFGKRKRFGKFSIFSETNHHQHDHLTNILHFFSMHSNRKPDLQNYALVNGCIRANVAVKLYSQSVHTCIFW